MVCLKKLSLIAATLFVTVGTVPAWATEPPADLCSLLPAPDVSKILGKSYAAPEKSEAPRPYAGTNTGTDCNYNSKSGAKSKLWFRAYVDPSPAAATELFARLSAFYGPPTPVKGLGDEAYFDSRHALHVRKGKVRFYINLDPLGSAPTAEKQIKELAGQVIARL